MSSCRWKARHAMSARERKRKRRRRNRSALNDVVSVPRLEINAISTACCSMGLHRETQTRSVVQGGGPGPTVAA
eukprot:1707438-Rhodomonas_salina.1